MNLVDPWIRVRFGSCRFLIKDWVSPPLQLVMVGHLLWANLAKVGGDGGSGPASCVNSVGLEWAVIQGSEFRRSECRRQQWDP